MNELNVYKQALDLGAFVIITDHYGNITYVNDKYCQAVGYESSEIIGQNPRIFNSAICALSVASKIEPGLNPSPKLKVTSYLLAISKI